MQAAKQVIRTWVYGKTTYNMTTVDGWFFLDVVLQTPKAYFKSKVTNRYKWRKEDALVRWVEEQIKSQTKADNARAERKAAIKAERLAVKATEHYTVGDVLVSTWGYDQTNVDFYQVVKVGNKQIEVAGIKQKDYGDQGDMSGTVIPVKDSFTGGGEYKLLVKEKGMLSAIKGRHHVRKWSGSPVYYSSYA